MSEDKLEKAIREIRSEAVDPAEVEGAGARVWEKVRAARAEMAPIRDCAGFQSLIPAYRAGEMSEARALLVKDHLHECAGCRKALARAEGKVVEMPPARTSVFQAPWMRWAMAAALAVVTVLAGYTVWRNTGGSGVTTVMAAEGQLFRVSGDKLLNVKAGDPIPAGAEIRTARNSSAVLRLADGSTVEMSERASVSVNRNRRDTTVKLGLGKIIVQAAKRRTGHLYVAARDCNVSVTGTVFSVNSGMKGSRVMVIEGEVRVAENGQEHILRPGEQVSTSQTMTPVSVADEVSWSRNREALAQEAAVLQSRLAQLKLPGVRYSSRLTGLLPATTVVYVAIPNLGQFLAEANTILQKRIQESPVLAEWWSKKMANGAEFQANLEKVRALANYLGEEIVVAVLQNSEGKPATPVFLAEVKQPGLQEFLQNELHVPADMKILIRQDLVAFSPDPAVLDQIGQAAGGFASTPFGQRIQAAYTAGAGLLFAANLETIAASREPGKAAAVIPNLRYVVLEQKEASGNTETRADLSFQGERTGVAAWIAAPAPIRALDFVSPEASLAVAGAIKSPAQIIDELFGWMEKSNPNFRDELAKAESKLGFKVRDDLAASLGGEFAFAVDGAILPPAWKLSVEVYDANRLEWSIEKLIETYNTEARAASKPLVAFEKQAANGQTYYKLTMPQPSLTPEVHYTFAGGYLLAGANRALLDTAVQYRAMGNSLTRSAAFTALLPRDSQSNFSGMVYHNLSGVAGTLGQFLSGAQRTAVQQVAGEMKPTLIVLYGGTDRITLASTGSIFSLGASRLGLMSMLGLERGGTRHHNPAYRR